MLKLRAAIRSIKFRIFLIVALCWLLPTIALGAYIGGGFAASLRENTGALLISAATRAQKMTELELDRVIALAKEVTYDGEITDASMAYLNGEIEYEDFYRRCRIYIERKFAREPLFHFSTFMLIDEPHQFMYTTADVDRLVGFRLNAQQRILNIGKELDTYCRFVDISGETYLIRNLFNQKLERYGMLIIGVDMDMLLDPLLHGDELWVGRMDVKVDEYERMTGGAEPLDAQTVETGLSEREDALYYTGHVKNRDYNLLYRATLDKRVVFAQLNRLNTLLKLMIGLLIPIEALILFVIDRQVVRPLTRLTKASRHMEKGELGVTVPVQGDNEITQLAKAYNAMSVRIRELIEKSYKEEIALRDARIQALQSRINPHFMNNSLELMNWQARMEGNETIATMIEALSTLLNASMDRENRRVVPIEEELVVADAYFYFLTQRFGDRLHVEREIDPMLLRRQIPRMVIQTLLENAVEHGIGPTGGGCIRLRVAQENDLLLLDVQNDGKRLSDEDEWRIARLLLDEGGESGERLGIRNVSWRLKLIYGPGASLTLKRDARGDTLARISIPLEAEESAAAGMTQQRNEEQRSTEIANAGEA